MGGGENRMSNFDQLPTGKFSALNVNIADMPYAVCSGAGGTVFFQDEQLAKTFAAREVNSGRELSMTVCKFVPVARVQPKSLSVDITPLDAQGKPALESGE